MMKMGVKRESSSPYFIPNFAALAAPLSDLTHKGQPNKVEWGEAQEKAYQSIKALLTKEPVLRLPDPSKTYFLHTDASNSGIGISFQEGVMLQKNCCVTWKIREYATFVLNLLAHVISVASP